jgi:hypothetical protein
MTQEAVPVSRIVDGRKHNANTATSRKLVASGSNSLGMVLAPVFVVLAAFTLREKNAHIKERHDSAVGNQAGWGQ